MPILIKNKQSQNFGQINPFAPINPFSTSWKHKGGRERVHFEQMD